MDRKEGVKTMSILNTRKLSKSATWIMLIAFEGMFVGTFVSLIAAYLNYEDFIGWLMIGSGLAMVAMLLYGKWMRYPETLD